nr:protein kinase [Gemmatimonadota bacterium]
ATFEERPREYLRRATAVGLHLEDAVRDGRLQMLYMRPLDLSMDEILCEIGQKADATGAGLVAIDSLSGLEVALAPHFRESYRESLYRLVRTLTERGVTVFMTVEASDTYTELRLSPHAISFLADDLLLQRYIELDGQLKRMLGVVKMRESRHSTELRSYEITSTGFVLGSWLREYRGLTTGIPERTSLWSGDAGAETRG